MKRVYLDIYNSKTSKTTQIHKDIGYEDDVYKLLELHSSTLNFRNHLTPCTGFKAVNKSFYKASDESYIKLNRVLYLIKDK